LSLITIGKIATTHGIKGELKVIADNPCFRSDFKPSLYINTNPLTEVHINKVRTQQDRLIVSFKEFNDINLVEKYKGLDILINKEDLDPLNENEYYIKDLLGLEVYNQKNEFKGIVTDFFELPQSFYMEVTKNGIKTLVPFIDEFLEEVSDKIIVKEIEGLFNEN